LRIGVPKERKPGETRVGLMPAAAKMLTSNGHEVVVEIGAGLASGIADESYQQAGAQLTASAEEAFRADLIIKVKEPQPFEIDYLQEGQILFTFYIWPLIPIWLLRFCKRKLSPLPTK